MKAEQWHGFVACKFVADVLKLESKEPLHRFQGYQLTGDDYDACGPDTLRRAEVKEGRLVFPGGATYRLLILPDTPTMSVALLTRVRDLLDAGAAVLGNPPQKTPGLTDYPKADDNLRKLVEAMWGTDPTVHECAVGKGRLFRALPAEQTLAKLDVRSDFTSTAGPHYIHRTLGDTEVYFLSHPQGTRIDADCTFRVAGKTPERWDAETGRISPLPAFSDRGQEQTTISIPFEPNGSTFIVFKPGAVASSRLVSVTRDGIPVVEHGLLSPGPPKGKPLDPVRGEIHERGTYVFTKADGCAREVKVEALPGPAAIEGPWQLRFPGGGGAPPEVTLDALLSRHLRPDPGVRYFSGAATYAKVLTISALEPGQRVYLDLGKVQLMAKVRLNGQEFGILWKPPYRVDLTSAAKPGANALEVDVVNLWVNRLIGDEQLPEDSERNGNGTIKAWPSWLLAGKPSPAGRLTFSSRRLWHKADPLQESGLIGPVTLQTVQWIAP